MRTIRLGACPIAALRSDLTQIQKPGTNPSEALADLSRIFYPQVNVLIIRPSLQAIPCVLFHLVLSVEAGPANLTISTNSSDIIEIESVFQDSTDFGVPGRC